jgi:hypothetical protein
MTTVDLRVEATIEARRLANARAVLRDGDERAGGWLEGDATWIAMPRRASLKRTLGGRLCLVWRVAFEDGSGRLVESRLVPVIVEVRRGNAGSEQMGDPREWIESLLEDADGVIRARVESSSDTWRAEVIRTAGAFSCARRRRAVEVPDPADESRFVSQPGLFDRRAERSREAHASAVADAERLAAERGHAIAASAEIAPRPARLLLVIAP